MMQTLEPLKLPLSGLHLIEASAGTGKTYTITTLYLRLLLGNTLCTENRPPLQVDEILVVTFTQAATAELRDRIRQRIKETHLALSQNYSHDPLLTKLINDCNDKSLAMTQLADALKRMDEAAVFTIHGFCQHILKESAFESGIPFDTELITDESNQNLQIIEDFWRATFYDAPVELTTFATSTWQTPERLWSKVSDCIKHHKIKLLPEIAGTSIDECLKQARQAFKLLSESWHREEKEICDYLLKSQDLNRNIYNKNTEPLINSIKEYFTKESNIFATPKKFELLTIDKITTSLKKGSEPPEHTFFKQCNEFAKQLKALNTGLHVTLLRQAIDYLQKESFYRKQQKAQLSFDDLLAKVETAIKDENTGPALKNKIRSRYPVAMIDEFQDTDLLQYEIFKTIYARSDSNDNALLMIGDPKQAIYSFRGADIFTYINAKRLIDSYNNCHTLTVNWRSAKNLVSAINTLFSHARAPFIYDKEIPFIHVTASPDNDLNPLTINGTTPVPLQFRLLNNNGKKAFSATDAKKEFAFGYALEIKELLRLADCNKALINEQPLQAKDIAILVRSHSEAQLMQNALRQHNIASVCHSKESVFGSHECDSLCRVLRAIIEPANEQLLRAALCTPLLGYNANQLTEIIDNETEWEIIAQQIYSYHQTWLEHGFIFMFQKLLREHNIAARILKQSNGERQLTNLLHLAELLQNRETTNPGMENLLRWLNLQRTKTEENEEQQLRLESDEALIKIVTIHKSKGLEYPIVFLPFIWSGHTQNNRDIIFHDPQSGRICMDINTANRDHHSKLAKQEDLAERLRLFYVAVTRAKYLCCLSWGHIKGAENSALGYLLHGNRQPLEKTDHDDIEKSLTDLADKAPELITIDELPLETKPQPYTKTAPADTPPLKARRFGSTIDTQWSITSYSALTASHKQRSAIIDDPEEKDLKQQPYSTPFQFPKGSHAGTFLHSLLEQLNFAALSKHELKQQITEQLKQYGFKQEWAPVLQSWIPQILNTPLNSDRNHHDSIKLKDITEDRKLVEMEFYLPLAPIKSEQLSSILSAYTKEDTPLTFPTMQGMLKGFIDLIFEHRQKYYIIDYKSNYMGDSFEDYASANISSAMQENHYNLQYLIYSVALHRYLQQRLPDYSYTKDIGGVYYLFLRGMSPDNGNKTGVFHDKPDFELIQRLDNLFSGNSTRKDH